jgi:DNA-damage-inducible protein J
LHKELIILKTINYSIRLDPKIKKQAEEIFVPLGLNLSQAFNIFLHKSILAYGLPFDVNHRPNAMLRASFEEAEAILADPNVRGYATIEELNTAMDALDAEDAQYVGGSL